jgi:predicted nuclease of restriction endonuclease-like (RecB) superfamily
MPDVLKPALPPEYSEWLKGLKSEIRQAQGRAALSVNAEQIKLYWRIGREILTKQAALGWGKRVIDRLAEDLQKEFPGTKGFSARNLRYMRDFAAAYGEVPIWQQAAAKLPWGHNQLLLDKVGDANLRNWYAEAAAHAGWTRSVLQHQIETRLHERQGKAITNFDRTLPADRQEAAAKLFKDPYVLDFIDADGILHERHLERALIDKIKDLLLELGTGFAFVGSQYRLSVGEKDFFVDLLFYHTKLHSYVVVDLKMGEFEPEFAGKMNFYLAAVDDLVRTDQDNLSIGLLLCRGKDGLVVEYALRDVNKPIAVAEYHVLPPALSGHFPSPEEIAKTLEAPLDAKKLSSSEPEEPSDNPSSNP